MSNATNTPTPMNHPDAGMLDDVTDIIGRHGWTGLAATVNQAKNSLQLLRVSLTQSREREERLRVALQSIADHETDQTAGERAEAAAYDEVRFIARAALAPTPTLTPAATPPKEQQT